MSDRYRRRPRDTRKLAMGKELVQRPTVSPEPPPPVTTSKPTPPRPRRITSSPGKPKAKKEQPILKPIQPGSDILVHREANVRIQHYSTVSLYDVAFLDDPDDVEDLAEILHKRRSRAHEGNLGCLYLVMFPTITLGVVYCVWKAVETFSGEWLVVGLMWALIVGAVVALVVDGMNSHPPSVRR